MHSGLTALAGKEERSTAENGEKSHAVKLKTRWLSIHVEPHQYDSGGERFLHLSVPTNMRCPKERKTLIPEQERDQQSGAHGTGHDGEDRSPDDSQRETQKPPIETVDHHQPPAISIALRRLSLGMHYSTSTVNGTPSLSLYFLTTRRRFHAHASDHIQCTVRAWWWWWWRPRILIAKENKCNPPRSNPPR
jgi:hypothetical protein